MTAHSDVTVPTRAPGEYAQGTMPRAMAEITAEYIRRLADHPGMAGPDATWLMGAQELIYSLLHCLDAANADAARAGGPSPFGLSYTLAGKMANLVNSNRQAASQGAYSGIANPASTATDRLEGLANDPELGEWAGMVNSTLDQATAPRFDGIGDPPEDGADPRVIAQRATEADEQLAKSRLGPNEPTDTLVAWLLAAKATISTRTGLGETRAHNLGVVADRLASLNGTMNFVTTRDGRIR